MFSVQEGSEVGPLPHGRGKFGVLIWQHPLTLKPPIKIFKKALKSEKARINTMYVLFMYKYILYVTKY